MQPRFQAQGPQQPSRTFGNRQAPAPARDVAWQPSLGRTSAASAVSSSGSCPSRAAGNIVTMDRTTAWISLVAYEVGHFACTCSLQRAAYEINMWSYLAAHEYAVLHTFLV